MNIVITNWNMDLAGGSEQWALTLADTYNRMGHHAFILSLKRGYFSMMNWNRVRVFTPLEHAALPKPDVAILCHPLLFEPAWKNEHPFARLFVCLGWAWPEYPAIKQSPYVAVSEECQAYLKHLGVQSRVVRVPADIERLKQGPPLRKKPTVLALSSRKLPLPFLRGIVEKCGFDWLEPELPRPIPYLERWYPKADIVIGTESCIIEGLATGRACLVCGPWGFDGWVTPDNVDRFYANMLAARADCRPLSDLGDELARYRPDMGEYARPLVLQHFNPYRIADELLDMAGVPPTAPEPAQEKELALA